MGILGLSYSAHVPPSSPDETIFTPSDQRRIIVVLAVAQVIGGLGNGAGLAISALLVQQVSGSTGWAGMAVVALTLGAALFTIPLSRLAAKFGRRVALTTGWTLGAFGALGTVVATDRNSLLLAMAGLALFGASTAASLQSRFAAADRAAKDQVGKSISIVVWATTIGAVIGPNLTGPGATVAELLGVPAIAGPMVFSMIGFAAAAITTAVALRPEPLPGGVGSTQTPPRLGSAFAHLRGNTALAVITVASSHAVMVAVMALTPVHMSGHGASLQIIGLTISLHIAGMYALSPAMGWVTDRWGAPIVILGGQLILICAVALSGTAGHSEPQITIGLVLLGIGWSASVIAGAAMLTAHTDAAARPMVQGFSDLAMNVSGAAGGLLAGLMVAWSGYGVLNLVAGLLTIPVIVAVLIARRKPVTGGPTSDPGSPADAADQTGEPSH